MTILVTPPGAEVLGELCLRSITFPPLGNWVEVDAKLARARGADRIAPADFEERIALFQRGESVDLAGDGQIRLGCSFALQFNGKALFGKFDEGHPTRGNHITPAAGLFETGKPWVTAYHELCEEHVLVDRQAGTVGIWVMEGIEVHDFRAREYAERMGLRFDSNYRVPLTMQTSPLHWDIRFGNDPNYYEEMTALVEFEADSSSIELILTGCAEGPGVVVDGERIGEKWRDQPIIAMTTKAQVVAAARHTGLSLV